MQRIQNVKDWLCIADGQSFNLSGVANRRVRLDVNAPFEARLWLSDGEGVTYFLASVLGRDVIEFHAEFETCSITAEGSDVYIQTVDGQDVSFSIPDAVTMTKLIERRPRNHEMELMMFHQNQNLERRLAAQRDELAALWDRREASLRAAAAKPVAASADKPDSAKPESAGTAEGAGNPESADGGNAGKAEPKQAK